MKKNEITGMNENHNPSRCLADLKPAPGMILIHRCPKPDNERVTNGGIVLPDYKSMFESNCSRVIAVGTGCDTKVGDYVFWSYRVDKNDEYTMTPQPVVYDYTDEEPCLCLISEKYILATCRHNACCGCHDEPNA